MVRANVAFMVVWKTRICVSKHSEHARCSCLMLRQQLPSAVNHPDIGALQANAHSRPQVWRTFDADLPNRMCKSRMDD